jgi:hypothetical protein
VNTELPESSDLDLQAYANPSSLSESLPLQVLQTLPHHPHLHHLDPLHQQADRRHSYYNLTCSFHTQ